MLENVLAYLHNDFAVQALEDREWAITDGTMDVPGALSGQYVRIIGSVLNDGVYQYPLTGLTDETFTGTVSLLAVPKILLEKIPEIEEYDRTHKPSVYTNETFGGYGYGKNPGDGWTVAFKEFLRPFRKMVQH